MSNGFQLCGGYLCDPVLNRQQHPRDYQQHWQLHDRAEDDGKINQRMAGKCGDGYTPAAMSLFIGNS